MEPGSYFLFLQEQIKDIIIINPYAASPRIFFDFGLQKLMVQPDTNDPKQTITIAPVRGFAPESETKKKAIWAPSQRS
jgi:hypothetical protein